VTIFEGQARAIERVPPSSTEPRTILSFRLERFTEDGDHEVVAHVEMRGISISGSLRDGDNVRVLDAGFKDGTLVAKKVKNETTGALIVSEGWSWPRKLVVAIAAAAILVVTGIVVYLIVTTALEFDRLS
jgi:hypothetical protein